MPLKPIPWRLLFFNSFLRNPLPILHLSPLSSILFALVHNNSTNYYSGQSFRTRSYQILSLLARCKKAQDLKVLKSLFIVQGLITHEPFAKEFLKRCFHLGAPQLALSTFELAIKKPGLFLQNLMLKYLCDSGLFEDVLLIYEKCRVSGCSSDNYTFPFVMKACAALSDISTGKIMHCVVLRSGYGENLVVQTALVGFYSKIGRIGTARIMLDRISEPDLVAWNAFISSFSSNGYEGSVFLIFREMVALGLKPNVSTFASVIPLCSNLGIPDIGKPFHGFAIKCGYDMDESLIPAFISMYASCGDILVARSLFDRFQDKNIAIWNAMISAYTKNQIPDRAFKLFRKLLQDAMQPNMVTFVCIIPSCNSFGSFWHGKLLHACVIKFGMENPLSIATALLSMYAKLGDINSAEFLFDSMHQRNLLSWNSMVSAYVSNGLPDASLATFCEMQFQGFNPDAISIVSIVSACSELEAFLLGKSAHAFSLKKGIELNLNVSNALLAFYLDCGKFSSSLNIFRRMVIRNVISWNTMISGCLHNGQAEHALLLFHQMQQEHVGFDLVTLISLLPSCNESKYLMLGATVHGYAIKTGLDSDVSLANSLVSMYSKCGDLESSISLFKGMPNRSLVTWNALLTGYRYQNLQFDAMLLVRQMIFENQKPNHVTWMNVLPLCYTHSEGKAIHAYTIRTAMLQKTPLITSLILMYARFGNVESLVLLFQMGEDRNLYVWNAVISAYVRLKDARAAFSFFSELLRRKMEPDYVTVLTVISACIDLNNLVLADSLYAYLIHKGLDKDVILCNALIDMYARCGHISFARELFELFPQKDPVSWSVMINGYGLYGDGESALALFSQMRLLGMEPDDITYMSILSACSHAGLVEQGSTIFNSMIHNGVLQRIEHYACVVDLLGRTGYLSEAFEIVKSLPHQPSSNLLESLLGACLIHGNIELGEEVGRRLLEMEPEKSGPYVLLYNIYAAAGRWIDADQVRLDMETKQLKKVPGFSLLEGTGYNLEYEP